MKQPNGRREKFERTAAKLRLLGHEVGKVEQGWAAKVKTTEGYGYIDVSLDNPYVGGNFEDVLINRLFILIKLADSTYRIKGRKDTSNNTRDLKIRATDGLYSGLNYYTEKDCSPVITARSFDEKHLYVINKYGQYIDINDTEISSAEHAVIIREEFGKTVFLVTIEEELDDTVETLASEMPGYFEYMYSDLGMIGRYLGQDVMLHMFRAYDEELNDITEYIKNIIIHLVEEDDMYSN